MRYKLDNSKAQHFQLSNDTFHYLMYGEEPLDESNYEEINEITAMFPLGFSIGDWDYVKDENDLIEVILIPYIEDDVLYDGWTDYITKGWIFKYRMISNTKANVRIENEITGEIHMDFCCNIVYCKNKPWVIYNSNGDASMLPDHNNCCQIPLWKCNEF